MLRSTRPDTFCSPAEASRALRKKLKHGNAHQQYRALVVRDIAVFDLRRSFIINSCRYYGRWLRTEDRSSRVSTFATAHEIQAMTSILCLIIDSFADSQMIEALKMLATDSMTDPKVKKKLVSVLGAWHSQFKDDPSMSHISHLYNIVKPSTPVRRAAPPPPQPVYNRPEDDFTFDVDERKSREEIRRIQEEDRKEEKRKAKEAKEAAKRKAIEEEAERKRKVKAAVSGRSKRTPFNYDQVGFTLQPRCCISIHICARDYRRNLRSSQLLQTLPQLQIIWLMP